MMTEISLAKELTLEFMALYGSHEKASIKMAEELIGLIKILDDMVKNKNALERTISSGYVRRSPNHPARQPEPQLIDPVVDDWIHTGKDLENV
jgi:hypothetical protein